MRRNKYIQKFITAILVLLLMQKVSIGLYLHNDLHGNASSGKASAAGHKIVSVACSCIDDFLTPFAEDSNDIVLITPVQHIEYGEYSFQSLYHREIYFISLRAPPSTPAC